MKAKWIAKRTSAALFREIFPARQPDTHKGDYGRVLLICGCRCYTGAPTLAATAAQRSGSGLVYLAVPDKIHSIVASKLNSSIVIPLPSDQEGRISIDALPVLLKYLDLVDACLLGPGLGRSYELDQLVMALIEACRVPLVLDADGINAVAKHKDILREAACPIILTPHEGEFARLACERTTDRIEGAVKLSSDLGCYILRKGHETIITDGLSIYVNRTGNPGMAVGGCGDALAGILTSILGRGIDPLKAAATAAWLHGVAGDVCAAGMGEYAMGPSDLIETLQDILP